MKHPLKNFLVSDKESKFKIDSLQREAAQQLL